jgi:hypothetical protein
MRVLNCSHLADTGGNGWRTKAAFDRLSDIEYRSTARQQNYLDYPVDLPWSEAREAWLRADVVHVRDGFQAQALLEVPDRPTVIHHHGTQFRRHRDDLLREQRRTGAIGLAATLDLYLMAPDDVTWMPALYDVDALAAMRTPVLDDVLRIAHAPTNRAIKSTEGFLRAARRLSKELPVEVILIERTPWRECMVSKAKADIYFDQVALGYGNNAIEAWGMGIPVIAGAQPATLDEMQRRFGSLPFMAADESSIYQALRRLADLETRETWGEAGYQHARKWHDAPVVVQMLEAIYRQAA